MQNDFIVFTELQCCLKDVIIVIVSSSPRSKDNRARIQLSPLIGLNFTTDGAMPEQVTWNISKCNSVILND